MHLTANPSESTALHCAPARQRGFSLAELITVIVIIGILAATAVPRFMDRNAFDSRGFYDQAISTLRYAQKAAIAKHQFVCVTFPAINSITLTTGAAAGCAGGANLTGPDGVAPYTVTNANASFTVIPGALGFDALGRPFDAAGAALVANQAITVSAYANPIIIEMETGYVH